MFQDFIPHMAKHYGFEYELVQYKWPRWLNQQKEKQRIIWGSVLLLLHHNLHHCPQQNFATCGITFDICPTIFATCGIAFDVCLTVVATSGTAFDIA